MGHISASSGQGKIQYGSNDPLAVLYEALNDIQIQLSIIEIH